MCGTNMLSSTSLSKFSRLQIVKVRFFEKIEAVAQRCSVIKVFLEISQNSQENTCAKVSFLIKLQTDGVFL